MQCFRVCNQKPISADHNSTGRVYNVQYSTHTEHERNTGLRCNPEILTYQLLGSQLWIALPLKNSRSPALNSHMIEIASIAYLHNFFRHALLSCSKILTYQLLGSQLAVDVYVYGELQIASNSHLSRGKQITP